MVHPAHPAVRLEFAGHPLQVLAWMVLACILGIQVSLPAAVHFRLLSIQRGSILAVVLAIPGVWLFEAACRWFCRNLIFSDDSRADFSGRAGEVVVWWIVWVVAGRNWQIGGWTGGLLEAALFFLAAWSSLQILRWFVRHVELTSERRFTFIGGYGELLGWEVLLAISMLSIIGWAWVLAAMYRWMAESTGDGSDALQFQGKGHEILWRIPAAILFSIPIVTIPWAWLWYARWLVGKTTIALDPAAG